MSELQELIQKLCPDGVEYKKLGDKQVSIMQSKGNYLQRLFRIQNKVHIL